jgi:hypothetical protein
MVVKNSFSLLIEGSKYTLDILFPICKRKMAYMPEKMIYMPEKMAYTPEKNPFYIGLKRVLLID